VGFIIGVETIRNHLEDVFKYIPIAFILLSCYVLMKELNMKIKLVKDPYSYYFLSYADVYGSVFCFSAVFLGIVSVLHI
jgi:hypothetical protein